MLTRGHKTLGVKWLFEPRFSHQSSLHIDSDVASKSPTFHTANRCTQAEKTTPTKKIDNLLKRQKIEYASPQSKSVPALPITVPSLPHTCFHTRTQIKSKI